MALFIRVAEDGSYTIGPLPVRARRQDTGQIVDPADWLRATGYYNVETATLADLPATLTPEQRGTIITAVLEARSQLERRRDWIEDTFTAWALAKTVGQAHIESDPSYPDLTPAPTDPPPAPSNTTQSIIYLYGRIQQLTRWLVGGGTISTPGLGDVLKVTVEVVNDLIEDADNVEPPE